MQMAGRLQRSSTLKEGSREEQSITEDNAWDSEAADRGHFVAGRAERQVPAESGGTRRAGAAWQP